MSRKTTTPLYADEHVVRLIAAQVALLTICSLATSFVFPIWLLAADFALRAFTPFPSPLAVVAKAIVRQSGRTPKLIFVGPKKFAAALGFFFSVAISVLNYFGFPIAAGVIGGVLLLCALLESVLNICLGCYVYSWLVAPTSYKVQSWRDKANRQ
jgi:hypothetical protein